MQESPFWQSESSAQTGPPVVVVLLHPVAARTPAIGAMSAQRNREAVRLCTVVSFDGAFETLHRNRRASDLVREIAAFSRVIARAPTAD